MLYEQYESVADEGTVEEVFGGCDIILVSCFTAAALHIIKVEKCLFFFFQNIKYLRQIKYTFFGETCFPIFSTSWFSFLYVNYYRYEDFQHEAVASQ